MAEGLPRSSFDTDKSSDDKKKEKDEGSSARRQEVAERLGRAAEARALGGSQPEAPKPRPSFSEQLASFLKSTVELPGSKPAEAPRDKVPAGERVALDRAKQEAGSEMSDHDQGETAADSQTSEADHDASEQTELEPEQAAEAVQQGVLENLDRRAEQIREKLESDPPLAEERHAAAADEAFIEGATVNVQEAADESEIGEGIEQAFAATAAQEGLNVPGTTAETADGEPLTAAAAMEYQADQEPEPEKAGPAEQAAEMPESSVEPLPFPFPEQAAAEAAGRTAAEAEDPASYGAAHMAAGGGRRGGAVPPAGPAMPQWHYNQQPPATAGPNAAPPLVTERVVEATRPSHTLAWFLAGGFVGAWLMHRHDRRRTAKEIANVKQEHAKQADTARQEHAQQVQTLQERIAAINQDVAYNEARLREAAYEREAERRHAPPAGRPGPEQAPSVLTAEAPLRAERSSAPGVDHLEAAAAGVAASAALTEALHRGTPPGERSAERPAAGPETRAAAVRKPVEQMSTAELTEAAEDIVVGMTNVRRVFETHLISEHGLRDVIREFQRGGDFRLELQKAILEKEQSYELDPQLRDRRPEPERRGAGAGVGAPVVGEQAAGAAARPSIVEYGSPEPIMPTPRDPRTVAVHKKQNILLAANAVALAVLVVLLIILFVVQG